MKVKKGKVMGMKKNIVNALNFESENMLYLAMYDLYDQGTVEAVAFFEQLKLGADPYKKMMIEKAERRIFCEYCC